MAGTKHHNCNSWTWKTVMTHKTVMMSESTRITISLVFTRPITVSVPTKTKVGPQFLVSILCRTVMWKCLFCSMAGKSLWEPMFTMLKNGWPCLSPCWVAKQELGFMLKDRTVCLQLIQTVSKDVHHPDFPTFYHNRSFCWACTESPVSETVWWEEWHTGAALIIPLRGGGGERLHASPAPLSQKTWAESR